VITEKPTIDYVWLYINAGLISKVSEEIPSENAENCRSQQPQKLSFDEPSSRKLSEYPHKPFIARNEALAYIFAADSMGLSSFKFFRWAPKDASFLQ